MATASLGFMEQQESLSLNADNFENIIRSKLAWSKNKWEQEGESQVRFRKLINSMKFWQKQLLGGQSKTNIIITAFHEEKYVNVCLDNIFDAIIELRKDIQVKGYATFRNPRYVSITFQSEEERDFVKSNLKYIDGNNVVFLDWAGEGSSLYEIKVHWLSDETDIKHSKAFMGQFFEIKEELREETMFMSGRKFPSGIITFKGTLKKDRNIKDVPHIANIQGLECLITIKGREYLCLCCNKLGHKANACPTPFCGKCRRTMPKSHDCLKLLQNVLSYADKVNKRKTMMDDNDLFDPSPEVVIAKNKLDNSVATEQNSLVFNVNVSSEQKLNNTLNYDAVNSSTDSPISTIHQSSEENSKNAGISLEENFVTKDDTFCIQADNNTVDGAEIDEDDVDLEKNQQMLNNMENYMLELKNIRLPALSASEHLSSTEKLTQTTGVVNKQRTQNSLKRRKTALKQGYQEKDQNTSAIKTYSRKGGTSTHSKQGNNGTNC